ncbi:MAG: hypothetical protein PHP31_06235 [Lentimicrobiaceae bacterium]|nr:hypothetical protein [Lentimicrobiaceae bacterium]
MKKITILTLILTVALVSCKNTGKVTKDESETKVYYEIENLLAEAADMVDQNVAVQGTVTHTCSHSGRRCFIEGNTPNLTIRVEAGETIGSFDADLVGTQILVKGILKETRIPAADIDKQEQDLLTKQGEAEKEHNEEGRHDCENELNNIVKMREWMKENNKDYYATYYIEGVEYSKVEIEQAEGEQIKDEQVEE